MVATDKVCSHIAKVSSELLKGKKFEGVVIRSGDAASAALVNGHVDFDVAQEFAEKLCETLLKQPYSEKDRSIDYTVSIGVAAIDTGNIDAETIFISADVACRIARNEQGNSFAI